MKRDGVALKVLRALACVWYTVRRTPGILQGKFSHICTQLVIGFQTRLVTCVCTLARTYIHTHAPGTAWVRPKDTIRLAFAMEGAALEWKLGVPATVDAMGRASCKSIGKSWLLQQYALEAAGCQELPVKSWLSEQYALEAAVCNCIRLRAEQCAHMLPVACCRCRC